jgi:K+-sensing histidine kinase KdpD
MLLPHLVQEYITKHLRGLNTSRVDIDLINSTLHEIRKFNLEIKRISEDVLNNNSISPEEAQKKVKSIFASSSLMSIRLNLYDFDENPQIITASSTYSASLYSKFYKATHILENYARDNKVAIKLIGSSYLNLDAYPILDFLPFVIIENAIKYSPENQDVEVKFQENNRALDITISSIGPRLMEHESKDVFKKGFRGLDAASLDSSGGGYGLYFAKLVCDLHDINISVACGNYRFKLDGVKYADFDVHIYYCCK